MATGYIETCQSLSWCQSFDLDSYAWTWSGWRQYGSPSNETELASLGSGQTEPALEGTGETEPAPKGSGEMEPTALRLGETEPAALGSSVTF